MRICRVAISWPTAKSPGAGLVAYYLCKHIEEPSLYVTYRQEGEMVPPPANMDLEAIDVPLARSPAGLNHKLHAKSLTAFQRLAVYARLAVSGRSLRFFLRSIPRILRFRPDIICCHSNLTLYNGVFFRLVFGTRFVFHIHAVSDAIAIGNLPVLRWMVNRAHRVYCISAPVRDKLAESLPPEKLRITSTGIDPEVFFNTRSPRRKRLIQVGQLMWYKGHQYILEAMPAILARHPDCELLIVGQGQLRDEIIAQIAKLGLEGSVMMLPNVSHGELRALYNESSLLVMPSLYEGLPKVLLEAYACGLPAVVTDACNAADISEDRGLVVPSKSPEAMAEAVCALLQDKAKWDAYSRNCEGIAETHDWKIIAERIHADYRSLLAPGQIQSEAPSYQPGVQVP